MVVNHSGDKSNLGTLQNVSSAPFTAMLSPERVNDLQNSEEINLEEIEDLIIPPRAQSQHQFNRRTEVPLANRNSMHDEDDLITEGTFKGNVSVRIRGPASPERQQQYGFRRFLRYIGPGLMMSVAYMDPGNVGAAITSRSLASYSLLWTILLRTLLGFLLQTRAINLGVATGHHLAQHCRIGYPKPVRYILWLMTELALLFGDFQETLGTSIALYVISMQKLPLWAGTLITNLVTFLLLQLESLGIRRLEALFTVSIAIMAFFFGAQYIAAAPPQGDVVKGIFIPFATKDTLRDALGTISSGVVPHNIYLHSTLVLSRRINRQNERFVEESILNNTVDTAIALFISFIVNVFVVSTFAGLDYSSCGNRSNVLLINAASCLVSNFGSWALYVWAIALFASGQSSACHGAYTGSFVLSGLMNVDMSCIRRTVIVRLISIGPSIAVALYATDINSAKLIQGWLNVIQALQLPLVLIPLLTFTMSVKTMGKFVNSPATSVLAILASLLLVALNFYFSFPFIVESLPSNGWMHATLGVLAVSYLGFVAHLFFLCFGGIAHVYYYLTTGQKYNEKNEPNMQLHLNEGFIPAPLPVDEATINARANMMDPITGTLLTPFDISAGLPAHLMVSAEDAIVFQHFWET